MSIITTIRTMVQECPFLADFSSGVNIDYTNQDDPNEYGIFPTGETLLSIDMAGNARWQYSFVLQAIGFTAEDKDRLENSEFVERFCRWMMEQNYNLPDLGDSMDAEYISAENGQFVDISEDGNAGTYQIMCNLIYERER